MSKKVGSLDQGTQFGELALNNNDTRQASIRTDKLCVLAYLERVEYQQHLKVAYLRDQQKQLQYLKEIAFFQGLTVSTLQKMSYNMKKINLVKNQVLYSENDLVDGFYLILDGNLKYRKTCEYMTPIEATTKSKWFVSQAIKSGV